MATRRGDNRNNTLNGTNGNDKLFGLGGNDRLRGQGGNDELHGGAGNDTLIGDEARDTYFFGRNFGQDIVQDDDDSRGSNGGDRAVFQNDRFRDARTQLRNGDLTITTPNGRVTFKGVSTSKNGVEEFQFTDGVATLRGSRLVLNRGGSPSTPRPGSSRPTNGNDTIIGTRGDDRINGLRGNDRLEGGQGRDTYVFDANFGRDLVRDDDGSAGSNPGDVIHFRADNLRDVRSARQTGRGSNANLVITTRNGTVTVEDFLSERHGIEIFRFKDKIAIWNGRKLINPVDAWKGVTANYARRGPRQRRFVNNLTSRMDRLPRDKQEIFAIAGLSAASLEQLRSDARSRRELSQKEQEILAEAEKAFESNSRVARELAGRALSNPDVVVAAVVGVAAAISGGLAVVGGAVLNGTVRQLTAAAIRTGANNRVAGALATGLADLALGSNVRNFLKEKFALGVNRQQNPGGGGNDGNGNGRGNGRNPGCCTAGPGGRPTSPILLDLDRDGSLDLVSDSQGGWTGPSDGFLAIDADGSGAIDQANEIAFTEWDENARTDLEGLALAFDTNEDGTFDAGDERFADFSVWQDANGDRVSQAGELRTLEEAGITSIDLSGVPYEGEPLVIQEKAGNQVFGVTTVAHGDGSFGIAGDVALAAGEGGDVSADVAADAGGTDDAAGSSDRVEELTAEVASLTSKVDQLVSDMASFGAGSAGCCGWSRNNRIDHPAPLIAGSQAA